MLTGNPGKRPLNGDEPRPEANIPECPPELGPVARAEWDRLVGELAAFERRIERSRNPGLRLVRIGQARRTRHRS